MAGGGGGSAAYMPSGVSMGEGTEEVDGMVGDIHGGGDTSESEGL